MTLTKKQLRMLNVIKHQTRIGSDVSAASIAEEIGITKSSAQGMLWHLAYLGMLERPTVVVSGKWRVTADGDDELNGCSSPD